MTSHRNPEDVLPLKPKPFLLLLVLEQEGPLHGYAIKKAMHRRSRGTVKMDPGGFYRLVARLERDGFVRRTDRPTRDADERRQYLKGPGGAHGRGAPHRVVGTASGGPGAGPGIPVRRYDEPLPVRLYRRVQAILPARFRQQDGAAVENV